MNIPLRKPAMTREQFFEWAQAREERYEFDGFAPVAMTGGSINHARVVRNLQAALAGRLRGSGCEPMGPDAGVATAEDTVRYPDGLITCMKAPGEAYLVPGVVVIFEVISPSSSRTDRIVKVREYAAVPSVMRYVILETATAGATVLERSAPDQRWTASALTGGEVLPLPEVGIEVPVSEFYEGTGLLELEP
jgi:Uma2 family endonuclease